jgi:hypothetical protein
METALLNKVIPLWVRGKYRGSGVILRECPSALCSVALKTNSICRRTPIRGPLRTLKWIQKRSMKNPKIKIYRDDKTETAPFSGGNNSLGIVKGSSIQ